MTASPPGSSTGCSQGDDLQRSLELGAAHGALAMTTPGDTSMASRDEVDALASAAARASAAEQRPGAVGTSVRTRLRASRIAVKFTYMNECKFGSQIRIKFLHMCDDRGYGP